MSTEAHEQAPAPEEKSALEAEAGSANTRQRKTSPGIGMLLLCLVFAAGLAYLFLMGLSLKESQESLLAWQRQAEQEKAQDDSRIPDLQQGLAAVQAEVAGLRQTLADQQGQDSAFRAGIDATLDTEVRRLEQELNRLQQNLRSFAAGDNQSVLLAEAQSLLRLGQQRLLQAADIAGALQLYTAADKILGQFDGSGIFVVREALASDLAGLRALPTIDVEGLYLELGAVSRQLGTISVQVTNAQSLADAGTDRTGPDGGYLDAILDRLDNYLVIRRRDVPVQPMLSAEQGFQIRQHILLRIEEARLALLQAQPGIYRESLEQARILAQDYLSADSPEKPGVMRRLATLRDTPVGIDIPSSDRGLNALDRLLANAEQQTFAPRRENP
ncbi:MAG: uroporphyrinogen-III C-methyltransferase [Pseudomonadales bacterium]|nr:uroporphyrinogen-III C-methyltransferase [Pseudomonadales bacterium]